MSVATGKAKKLYFDINLSAGSSSIIKLTAEDATTDGDRWGNLLASRPALNGNATGKQKAANEITAIFVPIGGATNFPSAQSVDTLFAVGFVNTTGASASFFDNGGNHTGTNPVAALAGVTSVFTSKPRVKIKMVATSGTYRGTLYIQQQHSIEA